MQTRLEKKATQDLQQFFPNATDLREHYGIFEGRGGSKDFNEVLMKEKGLIQEQNRGPKKEGGNLKTKVSNCMFPLFFS